MPPKTLKVTISWNFHYSRFNISWQAAATFSGKCSAVKLRVFIAFSPSQKDIIYCRLRGSDPGLASDDVRPQASLEFTVFVFTSQPWVVDDSRFRLFLTRTDS